MGRNLDTSQASNVRNQGGNGRLSSILVTRGTATPERPFVIEHREALIYMLNEAAELEHMILCEYLFAAFTMKRSVDEGITAEQLAAVSHWRKTILEVAAQEMLHLSLVQNILTAIGAAPHLSRPNLPQPARHFPPGVEFSLVPFGERALRHFLYLERPEDMALDDAEGFEAVRHADPLMRKGDIVPELQDFATVGHLYRAIEEGLAHLAAKHGEQRVFIGPPRAQATAEYFRWPELVTVTDLASARLAIETIVEQGEGARGDWREAHFGRFYATLNEFLAMQEADPEFMPARPVLPAYCRLPETGEEVPIIGSAHTVKIVDLFNVAYEILLQVLYRFFAHTEESDAQLTILADVAVGIMFDLIGRLGELITRLPLGPEHPGMTAGPSFELFYDAACLFPHREAAWIIMEERLREGGQFAGRLAGQHGDEIPELKRARQSFDKYADMLTRGRTAAA